MQETTVFNKNWERIARINNLEKALSVLVKECKADDKSELDNAYHLVFQDLMAKLLDLRNEDL